MSWLCQSLLRHERKLINLALVLVLVYYFVMDIILYISVRNTNLFDQKRPTSYSPFHPLSVKLLMTDPTSHYFICPVTELFDEITNFSQAFYFITPNIISFTHLFIGFIAARLVISENLKTRRFAVCLYEFRTLLDGFDGVVYRSQSGMMVYKSERNTFGYLVDGLCDIISGIALSFGCLFFLWKYPPIVKSVTNGDILPRSKPSEKTSSSPASEVHLHPTKASRNYIFVKVLFFGVMLALAAMTWDKTVDAYSALLQEKSKTSLSVSRQVEALHWKSTWLVMWTWRILEGQSLLQMILLAIFLDKIWEFLNLVQYVGFVLLAILNIVSQVHLQMIQSYIQDIHQ